MAPASDSEPLARNFLLDSFIFINFDVEKLEKYSEIFIEILDKYIT